MTRHHMQLQISCVEIDSHGCNCYARVPCPAQPTPPPIRSRPGARSTRPTPPSTRRWSASSSASTTSRRSSTRCSRGSASVPQGKVRMQELSDEVHLTQSTCSRVVARLEEEGLACRAMCADDRRGIFASLTAGGARAGRGRRADLPARDRRDARRLALLGRVPEVARRCASRSRITRAERRGSGRAGRSRRTGRPGCSGPSSPACGRRSSRTAGSAKPGASAPQIAHSAIANGLRLPTREVLVEAVESGEVREARVEARADPVDPPAARPVDLRAQRGDVRRAAGHRRPHERDLGLRASSARRSGPPGSRSAARRASIAATSPPCMIR